MKRIFSAIASLSITTSLFIFAVGGAPANAQSAAIYRLVPVTAASAGNVIVNELLWKCGADGCTALNATSRPAIVCAQAARQLGKIESFSVKGTAFDADALVKCNARAKQ
jgi:hypothetical protein